MRGSKLQNQHKKFLTCYSNYFGQSTQITLPRSPNKSLGLLGLNHQMSLEPRMTAAFDYISYPLLYPSTWICHKSYDRRNCIVFACFTTRFRGKNRLTIVTADTTYSLSNNRYFRFNTPLFTSNSKQVKCVSDRLKLRGVKTILGWCKPKDLYIEKLTKVYLTFNYIQGNGCFHTDIKNLA